MISDDPGTTPPGQWEINTAELSNRIAGNTTYQLPLLDINYGFGERLQLKYQMPWLVQADHGREPSGAGNGLMGVKWRFYDAGEQGLLMSTYPQLEFGFPVSRYNHDRLADPGTNLFLPVEMQESFGSWDVNLEVGRWFREARASDSWVTGLVIGHDVAPGAQLLFELHEEVNLAFGHEELIVNVGARWDLSDMFTLLLSVGRDLHNNLYPSNSLLTYLGIQTRF